MNKHQMRADHELSEGFLDEPSADAFSWANCRMH